MLLFLQILWVASRAEHQRKEKKQNQQTHISLVSAIVCTDPQGCTTCMVSEKTRDREFKEGTKKENQIYGGWSHI